jgi:uncharacterized oxidoreductase
VLCDVTSPQDVERLQRVVRGELGGVGLLINNAGVQHEHDLTEGLGVERARQELEVNLLGPMLVTDALLPSLLSAPRGLIANVTSALAMTPAARAPIYAASKAGLASYTRSLREQLAGTGVLVSEVVPPLVATEMTAGRQQGAMAAPEAAAAIVRGLRAGRERILVGKTRALSAIHRVSPALAARVMRDR